jgi:ribonuclease HI
MPGLTKDQATQAISAGWQRDALLVLNQCMKDGDDYFKEFVGDYGLLTEAGLLIYTSYTIHDIERAYTPPADQRQEAQAYTDGSGTTMDKPAGVGVALYRPGCALELIAENIGPGTNNRAELVAIWRALRGVPDVNQRLVVRSDSEYAIGSCTKDWNPTANRDLIKAIRSDLAVRHDSVRFEHVPGHRNVEGNEIADRLANIGRKLITKVSLYTL